MREIVLDLKGKLLNIKVDSGLTSLSSYSGYTQNNHILCYGVYFFDKWGRKLKVMSLYEFYETYNSEFYHEGGCPRYRFKFSNEEFSNWLSPVFYRKQ
jgi:hypothetical protein